MSTRRGPHLCYALQLLVIELLIQRDDCPARWALPGRLEYHCQAVQYQCTGPQGTGPEVLDPCLLRVLTFKVRTFKVRTFGQKPKFGLTGQKPKFGLTKGLCAAMGTNGWRS